MAVFTVALKTHSSEDVSKEFPGLNNCVIHNQKPVIVKVVAGRRKEVFYTMKCKDEECNRMTSDKSQVEAIWNKWNSNSEFFEPGN